MISVIIPTYNYSDLISKAITSVIQQDYSAGKIEIIVVDDGSEDNTQQTLEVFIKNETIKYFFQQNQGKAKATYEAIKHCNGKYIFNLDADDYYLPGKLKRTVEIFEADETIVHVASPARYVYEASGQISDELPDVSIIERKLDGHWLTNYFLENNLLFGGGSTYAARASVLKSILIPAGVDMYIDEFLVYALLQFGSSHFLKEPLSAWRIHKHNYSYSSGKANYENRIEKQERLASSSRAVFEYLQKNSFDVGLLKLYKLKHITRIISFKETAGNKDFKDILIYFRKVFIKIRPSIKSLRKYHVFNRLIPLSLFTFLKRKGFN